MLQILVVSGNHAERTFQVEAFQYGFGNGTANLWLRTSSELIDKDEAFAVTCFQHHLHVGQMRRIGTQVVFNTLLVANINKYMAEDTGVAPFVHGH